LRVFVDTSVWVDFFNGYDGREAVTLTRLIEDEVDLVTCGVVVAEILQGIRRQSTLAALQQQFGQMEWLTPREPETYLAAAQLFRQLRAKGITIRSTIDCIIAILAKANNALLLAKDRDLRAIVDSDLLPVRAVQPL